MLAAICKIVRPSTLLDIFKSAPFYTNVLITCKSVLLDCLAAINKGVHPSGLLSSFMISLIYGNWHKVCKASLLSSLAH